MGATTAATVRRWPEPLHQVFRERGLDGLEELPGVLLEGLNDDLCGEFQAIIMSRLYASMVQGPYRQELRTFWPS